MTMKTYDRITLELSKSDALAELIEEDLESRMDVPYGLAIAAEAIRDRNDAIRTILDEALSAAKGGAR